MKLHHVLVRSSLIRPGFIPPTRQMFYQYCDVLVPEIQTILRKFELSLAPKECHPAYGFLPEGFDAKCREIVNSLVSSKLKKQIKSEAEINQEKGLKRIHTEEESGNCDENVKSDDELEEEEDETEEIIDSDMEESL